MDNIAIINKQTGKVVATHRSEQNITVEEHYPPESYGNCEIVVLPKGCKVNYETMEDPRKTPDQIRESMVLTKKREMELVAIPTKEQAEAQLISEGKLTARAINK